MTVPITAPTPDGTPPSGDRNTKTEHFADEPLWKVRFTGAGRPDHIVTTDELDPYYRRNDVFEITPARPPTPTPNPEGRT